MEYGPLLGLSIVIVIAVVALFLRAGQLAQRVTELERWRGTIRTDMHEISQILQGIGRQLTALEILSGMGKQLAQLEELIRDRRREHRRGELGEK